MCRTLCSNTPNCSAWTYHYSWTHPQCFLYTAPAVPGEPEKGADSGACNPAPTPKRKCGAIMQNSDATNCCTIASRINITSAQQCLDWCATEIECAAWNFIEGWRVPQCFLHKAPAVAGIPSTQNNPSSGSCGTIPPPPPTPPPPPRSCGDIHIDTGHGPVPCKDCLITSSTSVSEPGACRNICLETDNCTAWTYNYNWRVPQCWVYRAPATVGAPQSGVDAGTCK